MSIDVVCEQQNNQVFLRVNGAIDQEGAEELKHHFSSLQLGDVSRVVIDLAGVRQIGSSGIGKILLFYKNLGMSGGKLEVVNLASHIHELFVELKLDTLFTVSGQGGR